MDPTPAQLHEAFWRYVSDRQDVFEQRRKNLPPPWTEDPIIAAHRFTNVYRAADKVSQFLLRFVLYPEELARYPGDGCDRAFRAVLFRTFNTPTAYLRLQSGLGKHPSLANFSEDRYGTILDKVVENGGQIWNGAYVMGAPPVFGPLRTGKHWLYLRLLRTMVEDGIFQRIAGTQGFGSPNREIYTMLRSYPLVGDFIAMQFLTDIGYALPWLDENHYIVPGPGAVRGVSKLLGRTRKVSGVDAVRAIERLYSFQEARLPADFPWLGGSRKLSLMDIQNCLCEFDKYCRGAYPDMAGHGKSRIKQGYLPYSGRKVGVQSYCFPPHWKLPEVW